ncbi:MAG: family transcriptional regulator, cyclic receptor protein [Solirubrobacteraceae bacterium]|nr:family transcriptional regulator, cyclic receptor protein [Solirubrobacteraceae bacterium]
MPRGPASDPSPGATPPAGSPSLEPVPIELLARRALPVPRRRAEQAPAPLHGGRLRAVPARPDATIGQAPVASPALDDAPPASDRVALLRVEPQFAHGIPPEDIALATKVLVLPRVALPAGAWSPPPRDRWPAPTAGLLLLDGIAARHVRLADRVATQLLGPGDVLEPWGAAHELLPCAVSWSIDVHGSAVVLDGRFATAARRWPCLASVLQERLGALGDRLATHLAICQLPRVELRVLALLWALAERFGRMTPEGVVLSLRLTHRLIGQLIGAQRPTVSLALSTLADDGHITRRSDGMLLLDEHSRAAIAPTTEAGQLGRSRGDGRSHTEAC